MLMLRSARGKFSTGLSTETGDLILKSNQSRFDDLETWKGHQIDTPVSKRNQQTTVQKTARITAASG